MTFPISTCGWCLKGTPLPTEERCPENLPDANWPQSYQLAVQLLGESFWRSHWSKVPCAGAWGGEGWCFQFTWSQYLKSGFQCVCVCVYCGEDTLDSGQMSVKVLVSFLEGPILMSLTWKKCVTRKRLPFVAWWLCKQFFLHNNYESTLLIL